MRRAAAAVVASVLGLSSPPARAEGVLQVMVVGPDGEAPARVTVEFGHHSVEQSVTGSAADLLLSVSTKEPAFVRALAAIDARGAPLPWAPARVDVPPGATRVEVSMPKGVEISGRTVDPSGKALAGVSVTARDPGRTHGTVLAKARSGRDGSFRLVGLGSGEVDLQGEGIEGYAASALARGRGGATGVRVVLRKAKALKLRVVDSASKPLRSVEVVVMGHDGPAGAPFRSGSSVFLGSTDAKGIVTLPPLDPTLSLSLKVRAPASRLDLSDLEADPWVPTEGDLVVPPGFVATLLVLDDEGRPVPATVHRLISPSEEGFEMGGWSHEERPDASGVVRVRALPYGISRFQAIPEKPAKVFPPTSPWVPVNEEQREAELRVPTRGHPMTVRATPASDALVGVLFADLGGSSMPKMFFKFDDEGVATVESVAPGRYLVYALRRGGEGTVGRVEVRAFDGGEVRVPLAEPGRLRIRPVAPETASDWQGLVFVRGDSIGEMRPVGDGVLESPDLPPGRYAVGVWARDGERRLEGRVHAETGVEATVEMKSSE